MLEPIREVLSFLFNDVLAPVIGIFIGNNSHTILKSMALLKRDVSH